jgi:hypothetical protein
VVSKLLWEWERIVEDVTWWVGTNEILIERREKREVERMERMERESSTC